MTAERHNHIFIILAVMYMFFNGILLPEGLLYTTLLAPLMFLLMLSGKGLKIYASVLSVTLLYAAVHWRNIDFPFAYLKSFILMQCVTVFVITAYFAIQRWLDTTKVFKVLGTVNLFLLLISLIVLPISFLSDIMWYKIPISPGIPVVPRLKMFTYEASYYSLIIVPVFAYYFLKVWLDGMRIGIIFISLSASLILSFSLGVIGGVTLAFIVLFLTNTTLLSKTIKWNYVLTGILIAILGLYLLYTFYPDNPLYQRIENILTGKDTSARGRTHEAFTLAVDIAKMKSLTWGIGLGQLKELGRDYIIQFYQYSKIPETVRIPNAVAETINIFGISGLVIRFTLIFFLFFKTKVWHNYYRLFLFIFMFIYQFTGSFIFNVAEYMIWCLAFSPAVPGCFDKERLNKGRLNN